eukprot:7029604-Alexandrium_andersonii.AAC.1
MLRGWPARRSTFILETVHNMQEDGAQGDVLLQDAVSRRKKMRFPALRELACTSLECLKTSEAIFLVLWQKA